MLIVTPFLSLVSLAQAEQEYDANPALCLQSVCEWGRAVTVIFFGGLAMTLLDLNQMFSTDERCRELMERLRWPEGVMCPRCKDTRISRMKNYARFECSICQYQFTVTSGTIFHDSHLAVAGVVSCHASDLRSQEGHERKSTQAHDLGRAQRLLQDGVVSLPPHPCGDGFGRKEHALRNRRDGRNLYRRNQASWRWPAGRSSRQ